MEQKEMPPLSSLPFGEMLRTLRRRQRLRQQTVAEQLGVHRNTIGVWERGDALPDSKTMVLELARKLRLDDQETRLLLEASLTGLSSRWSVPYPRNPFFTGREEVLQRVREALSQRQTGDTTRSYALRGLGGIGKTQTALEFAYQHAQEYSAILWIDAENQERLFSSVTSIATTLKLAETQERDQNKFVAAVLDWFTTHRDWLLIVDNMEDPQLVTSYLATARQGAVLLTTRLQAPGDVASSLEMEPMTIEEGTRLLLQRARLLPPQLVSPERTPKEWAAGRAIVEALSGLPLALDQAGAYLEESRCSLEDYLHLFQAHALSLLNQREDHAQHPLSVAATFTLSFTRLRQRNPAAGELLMACTFLAPEAIPEKLFTANEGAHLEPVLAPVLADPLQWNATLKDLLAFSLLRRDGQTRILSIHRLVQVVLRGGMPETECRMWAERIIRLVDSSFPAEETSYENLEHWPWYESLVPHALECLRESQRWAIISEQAAALCDKTATYLSHRARFIEAESLFSQAIQMREHLFGSEHLHVASSLNRLASVYREQSKYAEAERLLLRALRIQEKTPAPDEAQLALHLHNLGTLYAEQGRYGETEPLFLRAVHLRERVFGPNHPELATSLQNLATLYAVQGQYAQSQALFQRTLDILEQTLGPDHPLLAFPLTNLAITYKEQQQYSEAEALFQRALRIREQTLGPDHPQVAYPLQNLAEVFSLLSRDAEAEPLYQRVLSIREHSLGPDHPQVAFPLEGLAETSRKQGNYKEAEALLQRSLHVRERALGPDHLLVAASLAGLAELCYEQGSYTEAELMLRRALEIRERAISREHPETVAMRERHASLVRVLKRDAEVGSFDPSRSTPLETKATPDV